MTPHRHRYEPRAQGGRWRLDARPLGPWRWIGLAPLLFGFVFVGFPAGFIARIAAGSSSPWTWLFLFFVLPFAWAGLRTMGFGLLVLAGRTTIEVRDDAIVTIERAVARRTRRRPLSALRAVRIETPPPDKKLPGTPEDCGSLVAACAGEEDLTLAVFYPGSWLEPVAASIAEHCDVPVERKTRRLGEGPSAAQLRRRAHGATGSLDGPPEEPPRRGLPAPPDTNVTLETRDDGLTLTLPPAGFVRGTKGLFGFALAWCGFMVIFTGFTVVLPLSGASSQGSANVGAFAIFCAVFWAIGAALMLGAVNMARRSAIVDVVGGTLLVSRRSIFRVRQQEWEPERGATVAVGPSGMSVNDVPVLCLRVTDSEGSVTKLFAGRPDAELRWIASVLDAALRPGPTGGEEGSDEVASAER